MAEVEHIMKRIESEVPPSGVLYYKYKNPEVEEDKETEENKSRQIANKKILETEDRSKVKIRFSDLPISKASVSGLYKAKFIKLTDV